MMKTKRTYGFISFKKETKGTCRFVSIKKWGKVLTKNLKEKENAEKVRIDAYIAKQNVELSRSMIQKIKIKKN